MRRSWSSGVREPRRRRQTRSRTPSGRRVSRRRRPRENRELRRELRRKEKALAEAAALLILKKKLEALYSEDEDESTNTRSET